MGLQTPLKPSSNLQFRKFIISVLVEGILRENELGKFRKGFANVRWPTRGAAWHTEYSENIDLPSIRFILNPSAAASMSAPHSRSLLLVLYRFFLVLSVLLLLKILGNGPEGPM